MIFTRLMFLLLLSLNVFPQTQSELRDNETRQAYKFGELNRIKFGGCEDKVQNFKFKFLDEPASRGYIFFYGTNSKKLISAFLKKCYSKVRDGIDPPRIAFIDAGTRTKQSIEFWVVPDGAKPPEIETKKNQ